MGTPFHAPTGWIDLDHPRIPTECKRETLREKGVSLRSYNLSDDVLLALNVIRVTQAIASAWIVSNSAQLILLTCTTLTAGDFFWRSANFWAFEGSV